MPGRGSYPLQAGQPTKQAVMSDCTSSTSLVLLWKQFFYVDSSSPSFLRWKITVSNRCKQDSTAGNLSPYGYWRVYCNKKCYPVHSVVYGLTYKDYQSFLTVDHIDRCPSNNNPSNLRLATKSQQNCNRRKWGFKTMDNTLNAFEIAKKSELSPSLGRLGREA